MPLLVLPAFLTCKKNKSKGKCKKARERHMLWIGRDIYIMDPYVIDKESFQRTENPIKSLMVV